MSDGERRDLLASARAALAAAVAGAPSPARDARALADPRGAFVTLRLEGEMRGCMGVIEGSRPLRETVAHCAVLAATADPRFPPLTRAEAGAVRIEVSVISAPHQVAGPQDVLVGRDGVIVDSGRAHGLLLPQVGAEQGWNADQLLDGACRKAGLPPGAWRDPRVRVETFSADVFREEA